MDYLDFNNVEDREEQRKRMFEKSYIPAEI